MTIRQIFTIGHSTHPLETFLALLNNHSINCIIDVRSTPFSRMAPQYNKKPLTNYLRSYGITYGHLPDEFGARHHDKTLLDEDGVVDFSKVRQTASFRQGVDRLKNGVDMGYTIALMCAEANPFDCHRFAMISYQLVREGFDVRHILKDSQVLGNADLEEMLLKKYHKRLPQNTLFDDSVTPELQLETAYRLRNKDIGYSSSNPTYEETAA